MYRIKSDQNQDKSLEIMNKWIASVEKSYHHIYHELTASPNAADDRIPTNWTQERFKHIINLREEALNKGREIWADFVWVKKTSSFHPVYLAIGLLICSVTFYFLL